MAWSRAGKTKGSCWSTMAWILACLGGKVLVLEEELEIDGGELDEDEEFGLIGS